ncbi:hypothetical protein [Pedobacter sp. Leaf132]|uniref:hypothetical protein n=1 Tax=Pedobacter sp. Leaf132 TaxID=2876557 RepID=UPI001E4FC97A|nr:hypothetical protein [Pedobacter sp. Leaf132]
MATHYNFSTLQLYNSLQPTFGTTTTSRIGYYRIQSVSTIEEETLLVALWKLRHNEEFLPVNQVLIDSGVFEFNRVVNASVDVTSLIGSTINVRASFFDFLNNPLGLHFCNWSILEEPDECSRTEPVYSSGLKGDKQIREDDEIVELQIANAILDMDEQIQASDDYYDNLFYDLHN